MVAMVRRPAPRRTGFLAAAGAFLVVFVAGATPIPLYGTYRAENGITDAEFSLAAVRSAA
ncbi:hypothetical protein [uncultured Amnibacterium sp.]|uniref:hypothetical protein n=1 Tax=uncultured Amnibacterium sp. TaxID=1631851 RepID=UPI0035CA217D